jgi:hypothetical protein
MVLAIVSVGVAPAQAAEWQIKPSFANTFAARTTFTLGCEVGHARAAVGISGMLIGELVGVEVDVNHSPDFFGTGCLGLVLSSSVTTLTGNVVVAVPRHLTKYTLRPYLVGGAGMMFVNIVDRVDLLGADNLRTVDFGGGVTGFVTNRLGLSWDVRYFRSVGGNPVTGVSVAPEQLSFWRANMSLAVRF